MSGRRPVDAAAFRLPRPSPLGLTCPSWSPGRVAWVRMGWHPPRSAFRRPSGPHRVTWPSVHRHSAKLRRPSEGAHRGLLISPSEIRPTGPRPTAPVPKDRCPAELPLLGFSFPTTHVGPGDPRMAGDPSPAACRVQGLVTLFATSTPVPSDTSTPLRAQRTLAGASCRSVRGIPPSRRFPRRGRCSSRSPCPPGVRRAVRPPDHAAALQSAEPCVRRDAEPLSERYRHREWHCAPAFHRKPAPDGGSQSGIRKIEAVSLPPLLEFGTFCKKDVFSVKAGSPQNSH